MKRNLAIIVVIIFLTQLQATSQSDDDSIISQIKDMRIQLLPKSLLLYIKIVVRSNAQEDSTKESPDIVLLDNDELIRATYSFSFEGSGKHLRSDGLLLCRRAFFINPLAFSLTGKCRWPTRNHAAEFRRHRCQIF
jgi:hypothetical protein